MIVACDAEGHLGALLERLPRECTEDPRYGLLVLGDAAAGSVDAAARWLSDRGVGNATVLRNAVSQRDGGIQKLGYRYAIEAGFDLVILLRGDGAQPPAEIPRLVEAFERTGADVVLGTRRPAVRHLFTALENLITGHRLGGETGFRAYAVPFLRSIPFEIATNDAHFDTEILLQALTVGARIEEIELPAGEVGEVQPGPGLRHAARSLASAAVYRMHHWGMLCSLKYRNRSAGRYRSKTWMPYSSHARALAVVGREAPCTLLDLGCGPGHVAKRCEEMGVRVTGIDREEPQPGSMTEFHARDFERESLPVDPFGFDMVLMLDVVEHLASPEDFLLGLRNESRRSTAEPAARVVLTTPNVAFAAVRLNLLFGRFNYAERGILDISHKRLFTRRSLLATLDECGYRLERLEGIGVPFEAVVGGRLGRFLGVVADVLARGWPSLFAFQFLVLCRPLPGVRQLLLDSERR